MFIVNNTRVSSLQKKFNRKVNYKLYPNESQKLLLQNMQDLHRNLYNALLEQRIYAWQSNSKMHLSYEDQCKEITVLRTSFPEYKTINAQSLQETAKRLDRSFKNFFSRIKRHETPGFPRFKSKNRFSGWGYKTLGDGWRLHISESKKVTRKQKPRSGFVRISGVGRISIRGMARNAGVPKTMEVIQKGKDWFISVTFECKPERKSGEHISAFDWGVENFLTVVDETECIKIVENPRFLKKSSEKIVHVQKQTSLKKLRSNNCRKLRVKLAQIHRKIANCRLNFMHKQSCSLVEDSKRIITEKLNVKNITRSPKPKYDEQTKSYLPNGSAQKAGLNKSILDTSPSQFLSMVHCKAEEAGYELEELPTRDLKPSQRCAQCSRVIKKELSERRHICSCGFQTTRDANSTLVMLRFALGKLEIENKMSWGPAMCLNSPLGDGNHETPSIFT